METVTSTGHDDLTRAILDLEDRVTKNVENGSAEGEIETLDLTNVEEGRLREILANHAPNEILKYSYIRHVMTRMAIVVHDEMYVEVLKIPPLDFGEDQRDSYLVNVSIQRDITEAPEMHTYHMRNPMQVVNLVDSQKTCYEITEMKLAALLQSVSNL